MSIDFDLDRDPVEQIAEVFLEDFRHGKNVTVDSIADAYPQHADAIRALFPTLLVMEDAKQKEVKTKTPINPDPLTVRHMKRLGDYRVIRKIGSGGMGVVYEAEQESLGREVAIKVLSPSLVTTEKQVARFRRESQSAASLHHGNIVPVFGVGEQMGIHYYIMQRIHGRGLDEFLKPSKPADTQESSKPTLKRNQFDRIADIGKKVADALGYAHSQGILHRDIKPANLMLDDDGVPWIMDFGLAKSLESTENYTQTGQAVGTLRYMPPEQFHGKADERSDVYSLGITLYELLTWRPAFGGSQRSDLILSITSGSLTRPSQINPAVPRDLETIVLKAVSPNPNHRYQSATEMAEDLQRYMDDLPIRARRVSLVEHIWRWSRRNPALATSCASVVLLLITMTISSNMAFISIQNALATEKIEKQKADLAFNMATRAIDSMFDRFAPDHDSVNETGAAISPEVAELMQSLLVFYEDIATHQDGNLALKIKAAQAQAKIGRIRHRLGQHALAISAYEDAIARIQLLNWSESKLTEARLRNAVGRIMESIAQTAQSDEQHEKAIELLESAKPSDKQKVELARSLYLLARRIPPSESVENIPSFGSRGLPQRLANPNHLGLMAKAASLLDQVLEISPDDPMAKHLLGLCLVEMPIEGKRADRESTARFNRGIRILRSLVEEFPNSTDYRYDLMQSLAYGPPAHPGMTDGELQDQKDLLREAIDLGEELVREQPGIPLYNLTLAHCYFKLKSATEFTEVSRRKRKKQDDECIRLNTRAIQLQASVVRLHPEAIGYRVWLADFLLTQSEAYIHMMRPERAQPVLNRAIRVLEAIPGEQRQHPTIKERLDHAYDLLDKFFVPVPR